MKEWRRLGAYLRAERELRQVPLEDIAAETKIPLPLLERLEQGRRDGMPPDVFVRGFVRAYARCVGLPADEVARRHDELARRDRARRRERVPTAQGASPPPRSARILLAVVIALIIATLTLSLF